MGPWDEQDTTEPRRNCSDREKRMCLALLSDEALLKYNPEQLGRMPGFPDATTLRRWLKEAQTPPPVKASTAIVGRSPLLADDQLMIVGGFVLFCAEQHQIYGGKEIINFIDLAFAITVLKSWVSEKMEELGFSSHRPASLKYTYGGSKNIVTAVAYLKKNQPKLRNVHPCSRVVAFDQISFWDCGVSTSTYSPIGGCAFFALYRH